MLDDARIIVRLKSEGAVVCWADVAWGISEETRVPLANPVAVFMSVRRPIILADALEFDFDTCDPQQNDFTATRIMISYSVPIYARLSSSVSDGLDSFFHTHWRWQTTRRRGQDSNAICIRTYS